MTEVLYRDPAVTCQWDEIDPGDDENGLVRCRSLSQFAVERSDGDKSFGWDGRHEACEYHLAEVVASMADGDVNVRAIVTIRWRDEKPEDDQ